MWSLNIKGYIWPIIKQSSLNFGENIAWHSTNILLKFHEITWIINAKLAYHKFLPPNCYPYSGNFLRFFFVFDAFFHFFYSNFPWILICYRLSWVQDIFITKARRDSFAFRLLHKKSSPPPLDLIQIASPLDTMQSALAAIIVVL